MSPDFYIDPLALLILGNEKSLNFFEIQGFTSFFFLKKWCHQKMNVFIFMFISS